MDRKNGRDYNVNFQTRSDGEKKIIEGYFVRFDDKYSLWDNFYETIDPDAFSDTLTRDIVVLYNHDSNYPLARVSNNTLKLRTDNVGLWGEAELNPHDNFAMDVYERIKRGDIKQCSFGFDITKEETIKHEDRSTEFKIKKVVLWEVSPTTFPSYTATSVSARKENIKDMEIRQLQAKKEELKERIGNIVKTIKAE